MNKKLKTYAIIVFVTVLIVSVMMSMASTASKMAENDAGIPDEGKTNIAVATVIIIIFGLAPWFFVGVLTLIDGVLLLACKNAKTLFVLHLICTIIQLAFAIIMAYVAIIVFDNIATYLPLIAVVTGVACVLYVVMCVMQIASLKRINKHRKNAVAV